MGWLWWRKQAREREKDREAETERETVAGELITPALMGPNNAKWSNAAEQHRGDAHNHSNPPRPPPTSHTTRTHNTATTTTIGSSSPTQNWAGPSYLWPSIRRAASGDKQKDFKWSAHSQREKRRKAGEKKRESEVGRHGDTH